MADTEYPLYQQRVGRPGQIDVRLEDARSDLNNAIENVLKGSELHMPTGYSIFDKAGHRRDSVRNKWYEDGTGRTYRQHYLGSDEVPDIEIVTDDLARVDIFPRDSVPVFVGHHWLTCTPTPMAANVACPDYSVAKGGKLVAYRWDGEPVLSADKFHWTARSLNSEG